MTQEKNSQLSRETIYLTACALHGITPKEKKGNGRDLEKLYAFSRFHSLDAMVCMALEKTAAFAAAAPELKKQWQDTRDKALRKNLLLDAERVQILAWMEQKGIWYLPLKGIVLKDLYPKPEMRQMADNDILFDAEFRYEVKNFMTARGYKAVNTGNCGHDEYIKLPIYNFEFHTALFGAAYNPVWQDYYENVKDRLIKDESNAWGYHFQDEDFYVYITTHAYKHYGDRGTGLRTLVDTYLYTWKKGETLDWNYIEGELEKLGIADYERVCRSLAEKLFSDPEQLDAVSLTREEREMLAYFLDSGTYGTLRNHMKKKIDALTPEGKSVTASAKLRYLWSRLFPDMRWFQANVPFCYRHRWAIPFFLVYRILRGILLRKKKIKEELYILQNFS